MPISREVAEKFASELTDRTILTTLQIYKTLTSPPYSFSGSRLPTFIKVITISRFRDATPLTDDELLNLQSDIFALVSTAAGGRRRARKTRRGRRAALRKQQTRRRR